MNTLEQFPEGMMPLESQIVQLRTEMHDEFSAIGQELRAGDDETRTLMRVMHEEVINRIALLSEGRNRSEGNDRQR